VSKVKYNPVIFNLKVFVKQKCKQSPSFKAEYEALEDEFAAFSSLLQARSEAGLTQAEVAARMGISEYRLARIESSLGKRKSSPSLTILRRYAEACGKKLLIQMV
jgi:DNA-binding XRE family transcriptional regulator